MAAHPSGPPGWRFASTPTPDPATTAEPGVNASLTHPAVDRRVAASTRNQAPAARPFLYQHVPGKPPDRPGGVARARRPQRPPVILSRAEMHRIPAHPSGTPRLIAPRWYGGGLRVTGCLSLRVRDVDFDRHELPVRHGKGGKDRRTTFPKAAAEPWRVHPDRVRVLAGRGRAAGVPGVYLPGAIARQCPAAGAAGGWPWGFPSAQLSLDPRTGVCRRHHAHPSAVNRATVAAAKAAGVAQRATAHCFRHAFATHLLEDGQDIRTVRGRSGHAGVAATMTHAHALNHGGLGVRSPADRLRGGTEAGGA